MAIEKLTPEQVKLVEDNHNLILAYISRKHLSMDKWYDIFAIDMCQCTRTWDPEVCTFASYCYSAFDHSIIREWKKANNSTEIAYTEAISLDIPYDEHDGETTLGNTLAAENSDPLDAILENEIIEDIYDVLDFKDLEKTSSKGRHKYNNPRQKDFFECRLKNMSYVEIARKYGVTKQCVQQSMKSLYQRYNKYRNRGEKVCQKQ